MRLVIFIAVLVAASCFSPSEQDGVVPCGTGDSCPPEFSCGPDGFCHRMPPGDPDAAVIDADPDQPDADPDVPDASPADAPLWDAPMTTCNNGIDDDCDGFTDYPDDLGCGSALDDDEHFIPNAPGSKACDDGIDNEPDGFTDYHVDGCGTEVTDPGCTGPNDPSE